MAFYTPLSGRVEALKHVRNLKQSSKSCIYTRFHVASHFRSATANENNCGHQSGDNADQHNKDARLRARCYACSALKACPGMQMHIYSRGPKVSLEIPRFLYSGRGPEVPLEIPHYREQRKDISTAPIASDEIGLVGRVRPRRRNRRRARTWILDSLLAVPPI